MFCLLRKFRTLFGSGNDRADKNRLYLGFQKPHNPQHWRRLDFHFQSLTYEEGPSDWASLVTLQRLATQISEIFSADHAAPYDITFTLQNEVQEWRLSTPKHISNLGENLPIKIQSNY